MFYWMVPREETHRDNVRGLLRASACLTIFVYTSIQTLLCKPVNGDTQTQALPLIHTHPYGGKGGVWCNSVTCYIYVSYFQWVNLYL